MLSSLPPEIFDLIIDHFRYDRPTLKACCLVSKPCVLRVRRLLFAHVDFLSREAFRSWMEVFQDPPNSPAHNTRRLRISAATITLMASSDVRPWIRSFHLVVALWLRGHRVYRWGVLRGR